MSAPAPVLAAVRLFCSAVRDGDRSLLASVTLAHPQRDVLLQRAIAVAKPWQWQWQALPGARHLVRGGDAADAPALVLHDTAHGPRVDARYLLPGAYADDERRRTARAFWRALHGGDVATLRELALDARGIELLAAPPAAAREVGALVELGTGEPFPVPGGVQFVCAEHGAAGIAVFSGLTAAGEASFLLRQRDGAWRVLPYSFARAVVLTSAPRSTRPA